MDGEQLGLTAGAVATAIFVVSYLPMLIKAAVSKDLASYSGSSLLLANVGNLAQTLYVTTLPPGPIWFLHGFYLVASALMLFWWWRHPSAPPPRDAGSWTRRPSPGTGLLRPARRRTQPGPDRRRAIPDRPIRRRHPDARTGALHGAGASMRHARRCSRRNHRRLTRPKPTPSRARATEGTTRQH
jgi:hypothetical protein